MTLTLTPEIEQLIQEWVNSGRYQSAEEVVAAAIAALRRENQAANLGDFEPGELDRLIAEGEADIARGNVLDGDEAFKNRQLRRAQRRQSKAS